ncbi:MAG: transcriptional regulator [Bacteroidota bacterium]
MKRRNGIKKQMYLLFFSLVITVSLFSQVPNHNFEKKLSLAEDSLQKVYIYYEKAQELMEDSLDKAIILNKKALRLANIIKSFEACGATNELMGELFTMNNNTQPAINYYLISASIYEELNNTKKLSGIYGNLGMLYYNNNYDTERTLFYYRKSLEYAVQLNDKKLIADAYNRIGGILFNQNNLVDALYYFEKSEKIFIELNNNRGVAIALNNIGEVYRLKGKLTKASMYYKQSMELNSKTKHLRLKAINYENMGQISSLKGNTKEAFEYYNKSLELYQGLNNTDDLTELLILMGDEYIKLNDYNKAYTSLDYAFNYATQNNQWEQIKRSSYGLSKVFENKKEYKESLKYMSIYAQYNDSIIIKRMNDQIFDLQSHFLRDIKEKEIQIKDSEIELLENEQQINNLKQNILILGVIVIIILTIFVVVRLRFKVKKEKLVNLQDKQLHKVQQNLLKVEISSKDNDLINFALHLVQKNKVLKQLKTDLNNLSARDDDELNRKLKELSIHVHQSLQINKEIEEFQHKVDIAYDDFFTKLKAKIPSLTNNEKRLCALLRLNLSTKEISSLNNISIKAVEMGRYRLRKKFDINNKQSLSEYFQNI